MENFGGSESGSRSQYLNGDAQLVDTPLDLTKYAESTSILSFQRLGEDAPLVQTSLHLSCEQSISISSDKEQSEITKENMHLEESMSSLPSQEDAENVVDNSEAVSTGRGANTKRPENSWQDSISKFAEKESDQLMELECTKSLRSECLGKNWQTQLFSEIASFVPKKIEDCRGSFELSENHLGVDSAREMSHSAGTSSKVPLNDVDMVASEDLETGSLNECLANNVEVKENASQFCIGKGSSLTIREGDDIVMDREDASSSKGEPFFIDDGSCMHLLHELNGLLTTETEDYNKALGTAEPPDDTALEIEEEKDEAGNFELETYNTVTCYVQLVESNESSLEAFQMHESSQIGNEGDNTASLGEGSTSLSVDPLNRDVQMEKSFVRLLQEDNLSQLAKKEEYEGTGGAFKGHNESLRGLEHTPQPLPNDGKHQLITNSNRVYSPDLLVPPTSDVRHEGTEINTQIEEDKECRVVFDRNLSFGNRGSDLDMDETLWQSLPEDVLDKVLAWLPVTSCVRFRCVCKRWCDLMNSQKFYHLQSNKSAEETWVLSFGERSSDPQHGSIYRGQVFDPIHNKTHTFEFPFLPHYSVPVAAAGGLICFCCDLNNYGENHVSFYVCNPITKAWRYIPSQCSRVSVVTLVADTEPGSNAYKLFVFCEASVVRWLWMGVLDHSAKEYDPSLNRWRDIGDMHSGEQFKPGSVYRHEKVHLLSSETVQALDVQRSTWTEMEAPAYASCAKIVECRGRLLVVGDMVHLNVFHLPNVRSYVGIVIWEFDPVSKDWNEVARMPEALVENFPYSSFSCVVVDDLIYIFSKSESIPHIVVYAFSEQLWSRAANWCKEPTSSVFSFVPRLYACVHASSQL